MNLKNIWIAALMSALIGLLVSGWGAILYIVNQSLWFVSLCYISLYVICLLLGVYLFKDLWNKMD